MRLAPVSPRHRGFLLLEVILALGVFSGACVSFVVAMHRMGQLASVEQHEMRAARILDSALDEAMSRPTMEEGSEEVVHNDIRVTTVISPIEDLENEDGQLLQEMWHIEVMAEWTEDGQAVKREADTWRYGRMYQQ